MVDENALKDGWRDLLRLHPMPLFVTLQFNDVVDKWEARRRFKYFYEKIDYELISRRYKNRRNQRTKFVAVQESGRTNGGTDFHLLVDPANGGIGNLWKSHLNCGAMRGRKETVRLSSFLRKKILNE